MGLSHYTIFTITLANLSLARSRTPYDFVDPLIGTINGGKNLHLNVIGLSHLHNIGHVFPGATLPFGEFSFLRIISTNLTQHRYGESRA